jgi:hypothetical protein
MVRQVDSKVGRQAKQSAALMKHASLATMHADLR